MASLCGGSRQRSTPRLVVKGGVSSESLRMGAWGGVDYIEPARTGGGENPPDKMISSQSRTRRGVARCACGVPLEHLFFTYHKLIRHKRIFRTRVGAGRPAWAPGDRSFARFRPFGPTRARLKPQGSPAATRSNAFRPIEKIFALSQLRLPGPIFSQAVDVERGAEERPHWRQVRTSAVIRRGVKDRYRSGNRNCSLYSGICGPIPYVQGEP